MKVHFWGTRGSLPVSVTSRAVRRKLIAVLRAAQGIRFQDDEAIDAFLNAGVASGGLAFSAAGTYGTNTSCVEIVGGHEYVLCDAGTGIRDFGHHVLSARAKQGQTGPSVFNIFMSHLHWDHIQGFPFFTPAYIPGNVVNIFGLHAELERAYTAQQEPPFFPVPLKAMAATVNFRRLAPDQTCEIGGFTVKTIPQNHPGGSYGYRFERGGKSAVYSTDSEHKSEAGDEDYAFLNFFRGADLLIFDSQYPLLDAISSKENWGHSSNIMAVELSVRAGVRRLCIFHNEPTLADEALDKFLDDTRKYLRIHSESSPLQIALACDGLEVEI